MIGADLTEAGMRARRQAVPEDRRVAGERAAAGDHPGAADLRDHAARLDRAGAILDTREAPR